MLKVSTNIANITPLRPTYIGGHAMRTGKFTGVHDEIEAVILWLEVDETKFLFVTADLGGLEYDFVHTLKDRLTERFDVGYDNIVLSANHTHSGPIISTRSEEQPHDPEYRQLIMDRVFQGAEECYGKLTEVHHVEFTSAESHGFYGNRNSKEKYGDQNIYVYEFKNKANKNEAVLVNISCHSTVLSPEEYNLSGDFLAALRRELTDFYGVAPLVTNGNAGDMSNRLYRQNNDFNELKRVSAGVASQVKGFTKKDTLELKDPKVSSFVFTVEYDNDVEELKRKVKEFEQKLENTVEYDDRKWLISEIAGFKRKAKMDHVKLDLETSVIRLHDLEIVVMPCELVSAFGFQIKKSSTAKSCFILGYANGKTTYVVEASEFNGGHDGIATILPKGKAEEYVGLVIQHLFD